MAQVAQPPKSTGTTHVGEVPGPAPGLSSPDFSWTVLDNPPGFTVAPKTTEPDNRSVVKGQITNDLKPGTYTVKVITERTRTPFRDRTPYTQDFEFVQGNLKPKRKLVLAGGCDDENDRIHGTDLEFKIGGKLPLDEMRLEDNQGLFVNRNRAPYVKKNASDEWFFCSSDLVRKLHAEPVFNIGAYVKIPLLREQAIRVAHTAVAQTSGAFEALKILQPEDGRIYPNGAIQVQTEYTFDKAPAPHLVTGTISKGEAGPIHPSMRKSTYDKEFAFRGNPSGTAGFTADIIKKIPAQDDPANSLYGTVEVVLTDTRLFDLDDNNAPLALRQSVKVTGAEPSFWRNKLGGGRSGTYWNWATIIDPLADGRSFQIGSQAYGGKFGESGSWPGSKTNYNDKVRPADDTLEKLDALQRELAEAETRVLNLEPSWERSKRRLQEAITDYQQFVRALELVQTLKNLREEIKHRLIRLAAIEIELAELKRKPNPAPEDMERISQLEEERKRIREELDVRNRDYKRLLREILNIMKAFSPALLLEKSRESIIEAEFLRGQFEVPLGLAGVELEKARRLAQFILLLITTTEEDRLKQETVDPDETLKRRHLLNMLEDLKLEARARKLEAAATDAINAIKLLKDEVKVLREAEKVASKSVVLQAFGELLNTVTGRLLRLIGADKLADIILELLESLLGKFNVDAKEDLDRVVTAANNLIGRIEKIFDKSKETLAAGKELAKKS